MADSLPPTLLSDGISLATFDAIIGTILVLIKHNPNIKSDLCAMLAERFETHQQVVDEHGTAANVNAAAALRLIMMQVGCSDIPEHQ
jgi:hypothetical protein